ncbi:MAG: glucosylglycerol-phosphate synthase [Gemmatimonadetes bacterium]|nr:glucosylglycerol-phosphate synthase [Gemmatimonadota bacterium]
MILATDLDGTFLGGDERARRELYDLIRGSPRATLIFVTGRGIGSIRPLLDDPFVPSPHYIIADVGATVVTGDSLEPVGAIQERIEAAWPGEARVRSALASFDFLVYQEVPQERRCSFLLAEERRIEEIRGVIEEDLECDVLFSAGQYLDVLPRGVSKGNALVQLLEHTGLDRDRVVVAGDTLNDLSLFECDLRGIVVGGAEPALCHRVERIGGRAYLAKAPGGGGIVEGLRHHGLLPRAADRPGRERRVAAPVGTGGGTWAAETPERRKGPHDRRRAEAEAEAAAAVAESAAAAGPAVAEAEESGSVEDRQLVMVYHRLPFETVRREGRTILRRPKSPNGIIPTLLGFFSRGEKGMWVAWSKNDTRTPDDWQEQVAVDPVAYPNLTAVRIPLTPEDVHLFYETFSKEALWPVIFSFLDKATFDQDHWEHFLDINRIFAERTAAVAEPNALVWVHDYNLWMVPHYLRRLRPDVTIAFFHHTSFPASDIFNIIPWRSEIIDSLLDCDYIGFHIPHYVENFVDAVRTHAPLDILERVPTTPRFRSFGCALGVDEMVREIQVGDRNIRMGAHPVGINVQAIEEILERPEIQESVERIRTELRGRTSILSVERLDYVKGPLEKLQAFERLLENHPELHGKIVLLSINTPPAPGMKVYRSTRERVDEAVGRINGRFSKLDWTPVRYFYRSLAYEEVIAHYAVSDVAWITPLRDGLNMVAKEYIAANHVSGGGGTLLLSEFAGAAAELHGSLLTNPYHPDGMARDLYNALMMPERERRERMAVMHDIVAANNISYWSYEFIAAVDGKL